MSRQDIWIDAHEQLPPLDMPVWCYGPGCGIFMGERSGSSDGWSWAVMEDAMFDVEHGWYCTELCFDDYEVSHWAYLPEPPK